MCVSGEDSKLLFTNSAAKSAESTFLIEPNASSNASSFSDNLAISFHYNLMFLSFKTFNFKSAGSTIKDAIFLDCLSIFIEAKAVATFF